MSAPFGIEQQLTTEQRDALALPVSAVGFDWKNPDHKAIWQERAERIAWIRAHPEKMPELFEFYRSNPAQFINDFGTTFDPRNPARGLPSTVPFVLMPFQVNLTNWIVEHWKAGKPGIIEKARDTGCSWLVMAIACWMCLFHNGISVGIASRKEELVDRSGDPGTLMHKVRTFLENVPVEFCGGWDPKLHAAHMRLAIPATGSSITGEAGDAIGRGARHSIVFVDEAAWLQHAELIDAALAATTPCRIDLSSVNGMANSFARRRHSGKIDVFTVWWWLDLRKDDAWYQKQVRELDPLVVASEIDISYLSSVEGQLIPMAHIQAAVDAHKKLGITPSGQKYAGLDVADSGVDDCAFAARHGCHLYALTSWSGRGSDIFATTTKAVALCDDLGLNSFRFDSDGIGSACLGDARVINEQRLADGWTFITAQPYRGSGGPCNPDKELVPGRKNRDFFQNLKSMSWWAIKLRFQATYRALQGEPYFADEIISIDSSLPELSELLTQFSQVAYSLNTNGKVLIDKLGDGCKSPDLADATVIAFSPISQSLDIWAALAADHERMPLKYGGPALID